MAHRRGKKEAFSSTVPLKQPDRSGPDPSRETLLEIASQRGLLKANKGSSDDGDDTDEQLDPPIGRLGEAILWSMSLAMLHFTFDVLAQNQYAVEISWPSIVTKSLQAFVGKLEAI
jgi:hypothetical protein